MNKNILPEITGRVRQKIEYGYRAVKKTVGTPLASWTLALLAMGGAGAMLNSEQKVQAGGGPSRIACDGISLEWSHGGFPEGVPNDFQVATINSGNEASLISGMAGQFMRLFDNRNGSILYDVAMPEDGIVLTIFNSTSRQAMDVRAWRGANYYFGARTQTDGNYSPTEKALLNDQIWDNTLVGEPNKRLYRLLSVDTDNKVTFDSGDLIKTQAQELARKLEAEKAAACAPTVTPTATNSPVPSSTPSITGKKLFFPIVDNNPGTSKVVTPSVPTPISVEPTPTPDLIPVVDRNLPKELGGIEYFGSSSVLEKKTLPVVLKRFTILHLISKHVKVNGMDLSDRFADGTGVFSFFADADVILTVETDDAYTGLVFERTQGAGDRNQENQDTSTGGRLEVRHLLEIPGNCGFQDGCPVVTHGVFRVSQDGSTVRFEQLSMKAYKNPNRP